MAKYLAILVGIASILSAAPLSARDDSVGAISKPGEECSVTLAKLDGSLLGFEDIDSCTINCLVAGYTRCRSDVGDIEECVDTALRANFHKCAMKCIRD